MANHEQIRNDTVLINTYAQLGADNSALNSNSAIPLTLLGKIQVEHLYRIPLMQRICRAKPDDAILKGWEITLTESDPDKINKYNSYKKKLKIPKRFNQAQILANIYGGAAIVIIAEDGQHWSEPLKKKQIKTIKKLKVLDRYKIVPVLSNIGDDPLEPTYYQFVFSPQEIEKLGLDIKENSNKPSGYIHHSRIIRFDGVELPPDSLRANNGWGMSLIESVYRDYDRWDRGLESMTAMVEDFSLFIYKISHLGEMVADNDEEVLKNRFRSLRMGIKTLGGAAIDKENEDISFVTRQFAGIDGVSDKLRDATIGASGQPHTKLFGESPSGLGASGDSELKHWSADIQSFQVSQWQDKLEYLNDLIMLAQDNPDEENEGLGIKFFPFLQESQQDTIATRSTQAQLDNTYLGAGVLLPEEIRKSRFGSTEYSFETVLDDKAWEASKQEQQGGFDQFGGGEQEQPAEEEGILPEVPDLEKENPELNEDSIRSDGADPIKRVVNWGGLQVGVTHNPGDRRFAMSDPMTVSYGHIRGSYGDAPDGKAVDVYLGDEGLDGAVYKVRQLDPETGLHDEDKYFFGFPDTKSVKHHFVYHAGGDRFGGIELANLEDLDKYRVKTHTDSEDCGCEQCALKAKAKRRKKVVDSAIEKNKPTRPGYVWVENNQVKNRGFWRKLPKGTGIAAGVATAAIGVGVGAAILANQGKGKSINQEVNPGNASGDLPTQKRGLKTALAVGTVGAGAAAIALSKRNRQSQPDEVEPIEAKLPDNSEKIAEAKKRATIPSETEINRTIEEREKPTTKPVVATSGSSRAEEALAKAKAYKEQNPKAQETDFSVDELKADLAAKSRNLHNWLENNKSVANSSTYIAIQKELILSRGHLKRINSHQDNFDFKDAFVDDIDESLLTTESAKQTKAAIKETIDLIGTLHYFDTKLSRGATYGLTSNPDHVANYQAGSVKDKNGNIKSVPIGLQLNPEAIEKFGKPFAKFGFVHEMGHYLDHAVLGSDLGDYASGTRNRDKSQSGSHKVAQASNYDPEVKDLMAALQKTESVQQLEQLKKSDDSEEVAYALMPTELFARAYSQYVAQKTKDPDLMEGLRTMKKLYTGTVNKHFQWDEDEFETQIIPLFDKMLKKKGLLK